MGRTKYDEILIRIFEHLSEITESAKPKHKKIYIRLMLEIYVVIIILPRREI